MTAWAGTRRLVRLALRRDRVVLPVWVVTICGSIVAVIASETAIYRDPAQRAAGATFGAANVTTRITDGPASGTNLGAMSMVESYLVLAIFVSLMAAQAVVRHTRLDEETGRAELIGSSVVGRHARLTAALIVGIGASLIVGLTSTIVLAAYGLGVPGAVAAGVSLAGVGVAFASLAGVAAQVAVTQRGANAIVGASLGVAFALRAVGDAFGSVAPSKVELISAWPSWLSPIGWGQQIRAFDRNLWWVGALFAGFAVVAVGVAYRLSTRRDLGAGFARERPGPSVADPSLLSPRGLAWRLQRGTLIAWVVGMSAFGACFGAMASSIGDFEEASPQLAQMLREMFPGAEIVDVFAGFMMAFLALAGAAYTVQALLKMRAEEASGRLEPVLSTAVARRRWFASHGGIAAVGTAIVLGSMGTCAGVTAFAVTGNAHTALGFAGAGFVAIVPALALGAFVVAAIAFAPRWAVAVGWAALGASLVVGQLGEILKLPPWALDLSPFTHAPVIPAEPFRILPVALLLAAAAAFAGAAFARFRSRDLAIPA